MKAVFLKNIIQNYGIINGEYVDSRVIRKITKETTITLKELAIGLGLSPCALTKIRKNKPYKTKVTIYSQEEYQKIAKHIRDSFKTLQELEDTGISFLKKLYRLSDADMIRILQISKREYVACMQKKKMLIWKDSEVKVTKQEKEVLEEFKKKGEINQAEIKELEKTVTEEKIQYELQISKEDYQKVKKGTRKKVPIVVIEDKEKQKGKKEFYSFLKNKDVMTYQELQDIKNGTSYPDFYIRTCFDISKIKYDALKNGKRKKIILLEESKKRRIDELKIDLKYLAKYGQRDYTKEEIKRLCQDYEIEEKLFLQYVVGKVTLYPYYQKAYDQENAILFIGDEKQATNEFIERNFYQIEKNINQLIYHLAKIYQCWNEIDNLRSIAYVKIVEEGGKYEVNFSYNPEIAIRLISKMCKYEMMKYLFKVPKELGLIQEIKGNEINLLDTIPDFTYDPRKSSRKGKTI